MIGSRSCSIYLWHPPAVHWGVTRFNATPLPWWAVAALYFGGSLAIGMVLHSLVEVAALWLRDRWSPARRPDAAPVPLARTA